MPPVELSGNPGENAGNQPTTIVPVPAAFVPPSVKAKIGIIYPPPEVRNIVDKTASFVARNGPSFESKVKEAEANNSKFNFLNPHDPYHAYYLHKVKEFMEGKATIPGATEQQQQAIAPTPSMQPPVNKVQAKVQSEMSKFFEPIVIKDPPSEYEFMIEPQSISAYDLDIVKLTAQFVARNGRQFLTSLMSKEARNPQFDFLKPAHGLFNYFTKLVEQYTKILIPSKELLSKLSTDIDNQQKVMDEVNYRVEWVKHQLRERAKEEEAVEKERAAYSQIDWHDFVVVETVDYQPQEQGNFPPPTTPEMVGARMLLQERLDRTNFQHITSTTMSMSDLPSEMDMGSPPHSPPSAMMSTVNMQEMDMEQDDEDMNVPPPPQVPQPPSFPRGAPNAPVMISRIPASQHPLGPPPLPTGLPTPGLPPTSLANKVPAPLKPQDVIIKSYNPKDKMLTINQGEQYLISPITKEKIPANSISSHTKYALLDPTWIQRREKEVAEQQDKEQVYEPGSHVELELKKFAERRTDIFGTGAQETIIGRKIGEEDRRGDDKVQWDGHTATAEKTSKKAMANMSMEEQSSGIHRSQGHLEDEASAANRIGPAIPKPTTSTYASTAKTIQKPPQLSPLVTKPMMPMGTPQQRTLVATPMMPRPGMQPMTILPQGAHTMVAMPSMVAVAPQPPLHPPPLVDEPASKRAKTEDQLMPEEDFYKTFGRGQVTITIQLPIVPEKPEWNLNGQALPLTLPITDPISVIKAKLADLLGGMPAGKQKLVYNDMFVKDSNSLGFYNMMKGSVVYLQLKERGGRKK